MEETQAAAPAAQPKPVRKRRGPTVRQRMAQNRSSHNFLLTAVFLLVLVIFCLINLFTKDKAFSDTENRSLAQKPAFSLSALADGSFFSGLSDHYNDQFPGRDSWISMHLWEIRRLGQKESGGVYLGAENRLLSEPETPNEAALDKTVAAMNQFTQDHPEIVSRMLLVPGASAVLSDSLPKNAPVRDQLQDIADVRVRLSTDIAFLDAIGPLSSHAGEEIYYKTDHHWTSLGAYYVYEANIDALDIRDRAGSFEVYTVTNDFEGTLASKSGSHAVKDSIQIYAPADTELGYYVSYGDSTDKICSIYNTDALSVKDKYTVFFGGNHDKVEIRTTANNDRTLLIFKDSYANCFMQFLVPCYERIIMIDPRYYYGTLDSILNYGVTDILYLYSADTFLVDTSLADVLTASSEDAQAPMDVGETETTAVDSASDTMPEMDAAAEAESSAETQPEDSAQEDAAETSEEPVSSEEPSGQDAVESPEPQT